MYQNKIIKKIRKLIETVHLYDEMETELITETLHWIDLGAPLFCV